MSENRQRSLRRMETPVQCTVKTGGLHDYTLVKFVKHTFNGAVDFNQQEMGPHMKYNQKAMNDAMLRRRIRRRGPQLIGVGAICMAWAIRYAVKEEYQIWYAEEDFVDWERRQWEKYTNFTQTSRDHAKQITSEPQIAVPIPSDLLQQADLERRERTESGTDPAPMMIQKSAENLPDANGSQNSRSLSFGGLTLSPTGPDEMLWYRPPIEMMSSTSYRLK